MIDDDPAKRGRSIRGIKIVGGRDEIQAAAVTYKVVEIVFAIPSIPEEEKAEILKICKDTGCYLKIVPSMYQILSGEVALETMRKVEIEDLLGREPVRVDLDAIMGYVENKTVLVTGGGGSIGSELCRQVARHKPKELIIFDIYENNAYAIQMELTRRHPELNLTVLIGSVRDGKRIRSVFESRRPNLVFHAAAHKHVPLMEDSPHEAIKNNVFGTLNTVQAAIKYGAEKFVLI